MTNSRGVAIPDVRLDVDDSDAVTTQANGEFVFARVPVGTRLLTARKIGFEPTEQVLQLTGTSASFVNVTMSNPV